MQKLFIFFLVVAGFSTSALAQVIYLPVVFQYQASTSFYYAGRSASVFRDAEYPVAGAFGRVNGWVFASGSVDTHREVATEPARIYTDRLPGRNARLYGYTVADVQNEANAGVPCYFKKRDLLAGGQRTTDGSLEIPSSWPGTGEKIEIKGFIRLKRVSTPRPLMIIPREGLRPDVRQFCQR